MMHLIQYGKLGFLADAACAFAAARGDRVVVTTERGWELGVVMASNPAGMNPAARRIELVRTATLADIAAAERNEAFGQEILAVTEAAGLPISFIDIEVTLDRAAAVLHALPYDACDASPALAALSDRFDLAVRLLDLSRERTSPDPPDPEKMTCGKPDCGTGSGCSSCSTGGCSTGSCSKGSVKSAEELTSFFTDLREKMHARTPLV
jgi:hypothetical protein